MDIVYLLAAATFWVAVVGLTYGCARLQARKAGS
jgi:hypothetical protein